MPNVSPVNQPTARNATAQRHRMPVVLAKNSPAHDTIAIAVDCRTRGFERPDDASVSGWAAARRGTHRSRKPRQAAWIRIAQQTTSRSMLGPGELEGLGERRRRRLLLRVNGLSILAFVGGARVAPSGLVGTQRGLHAAGAGCAHRSSLVCSIRGIHLPIVSSCLVPGAAMPDMRTLARRRRRDRRATRPRVASAASTSSVGGAHRGSIILVPVQWENVMQGPPWRRGRNATVQLETRKHLCGFKI